MQNFILLSLIAFTPKYGPENTPRALPLSKSDSSLKKALLSSSDFWLLNSFYVGQMNDSSCSLAALTGLLNALSSQKNQHSEDKNLSQREVLKKYLTKSEAQRFDSKTGTGFSLEEFSKLSLKVLSSAGFKVNLESLILAELEKNLRSNDRSSSDFIFVNFLQSAATNDAKVGHWALVGAYDDKSKRVLILDPDREWYEPYWIASETLLQGMQSKENSGGQARGYFRVQILSD